MASPFTAQAPYINCCSHATKVDQTNNSKCEFHTTSSQTKSHDPEFAYLQCSIGFLEGKHWTDGCASRVATCLANSPSLCTSGCQTRSRVNKRLLHFICKKRKFAHPTADEVCGQTPLWIWHQHFCKVGKCYYYTAYSVHQPYVQVQVKSSQPPHKCGSPR